MTTPFGRTHPVLLTRAFLERLSIGSAVLDRVRAEADGLLRHYPDAGCMEHAAIAWPSTWEMVCDEPSVVPSHLDFLLRKQSRLRPKQGRIRRRALSNRHSWPGMTADDEVEQSTSGNTYSRPRTAAGLVAVGHAVAWFFMRRVRAERN